MSEAYSATAAIFTLMSLAGLWILVFWLYRDYQIDWFREKMFALRNQLFDAASAGRIDFDHPAYGTLRTAINGFIRFAHRMSLLQVILFWVLNRRSLARMENPFEARWRSATAGLRPEVLTELEEYKNRFHLLVVTHVCFNSPILLISIVVPLAIWVFGKLWAKKLIDLLQKPLGSIDATAFAIGRIEQAFRPIDPKYTPAQ